MKKQRLFILIFSIIGIVAIFFPIASFYSFIGNVYVYSYTCPYGWFIFILSAICLIISTINNVKNKLSLGKLITIWICSILILIITISWMGGLSTIEDTHIGMGLYIYLLEGLLIPIFSLIFYNSKDKIPVDSKSNITSIADELKKLNDLKDSGVINEIEFQQQKEKLLNK